MLFVILGGCMAALGLMILFVGFLATGATRHKVYRAWTARVSGRISCAVVSSFDLRMDVLFCVCLFVLYLLKFEQM